MRSGALERRLSGHRIEMRIALAIAMLSITACSGSGASSAPTPASSAPSPSAPAPAPTATVTLDLGRYKGGTSAQLANSSLAIRPDLASSMVTVTGESASFREVYNRLTCRTVTDPGFLDQAFASQVDPAMAAAVPLHVESATVSLLDGATAGGGPSLGACFAYRTKDGQWHGQFAPIAGTHDPTVGATRVTLEIHADDVDVLGIMFEDVYVNVSDVSYVARP